MKVKKIQDAMKAQGISTRGLHAELVAQLVQGVSEGVAGIKYRPAEEAQNNAGDAFAPGAYLKLSEPELLPVDESVIPIDDVKFLGPAVPAQEHVVDFDNCPKKEIIVKPSINCLSLVQYCFQRGNQTVH